MTRSDYQALGIVALALALVFALNTGGALAVANQDERSHESADDVVALINQYRASQGLAALRGDMRLAGAATFHNRWMRDQDCFSHICPGEPSPGERAVAAGYPSAGVGEVIGRGYPTAADVVMGWRNSPGHDAVLRGGFLDIGCAVEDGQTKGGPWWTCVFGSAGGGPLLPTATPRASAPTPTKEATKTPTARAGLPAGQLMEVTGRFGVFGLPRPAGCPALAGLDCLLTLRVDYDLSDWGVTDYLYYTYCLRPDVMCRWPWKGR